ncbi:PHP domain-containing protein [Patescibacteria group bacterium]|nr:PHP domain-containing protein [Patescibacteria group bacterium]MBU1663158.1 PHP domain-containing protein [Patescibacteria group bacterium]MBU1934254.1 PHP domain-containing protein [Patescibacteria group bacterium]MBU2007685.1 PHP domain-containing protein [Patescibacteria group bacterium]MBU2233835.1 PHP domain-containing protein [Patescibacteria group bacterium]
MPVIDLHFHSSYSGGKLTIPELAVLIKKIGLKYCSLTDHDTVDGVSELQEYLKGYDIIVIPGIELTALYKQQEIHILAYDFEIDKITKVLRKKQKITEQKKINELKLAKRLFKQNGFAVSNNLKAKKGQPAGLTIALDVYYNPKNLKKINGQSPEQFYNSYQAPGAPCYTERSGVGVEWIIDNFKKISNDLILAHPFNPVSYLIKPLKIKDIKCLVGMGLDGIEVYHPDLSDKQINILKNLAQKNNWYFTGGSDYHGHEKNNNKQLGYIKDKFIIDSFKLHGYTK